MPQCMGERVYHSDEEILAGIKTAGAKLASKKAPAEAVCSQTTQLYLLARGELGAGGREVAVLS